MVTTALAPRPYQLEALAAIQTAAARGLRRPLIALPTGTGKTIIFALLAAQRPGRTLILAHRDELIQQAVEKLRLVLGDVAIGVVKAARNDVAAPLVVASVQTLAQPRRLAQLAHDWRTIIVDEAHHAAAPTYRRILDALGTFATDGPLTLGVTATPDRADRVGLDCVFEAVVYQADLLAMIQQGYLVDLRAVQVLVDANLDAVPWRGGDWADGALGAALLAANAPAHVVAAYQAHAAGRRAVCFTPTIAVAHAVAATFQEAGIAAAALDGTTPTDTRHALLARFAADELQVLANCAVLTEGWDCPPCDCVILARPTSSRGFYLQMLGRGTRPYPGKEDCLLLDVVGSSVRHDVLTAATLFGLDPTALDGATVTEAIAQREAEEREREQQRQVPGRLVAAAVDIFARRRLHWVRAGARFVLPNGAGQYVLELEGPGGAWRLLQQTRDGTTLVRGGLPLEYAQGVAEDLVRQAGALHLADPAAAWRREPPTEKQVAALRRFRQPVPPTRGAASDLLSALFATAS